MNRWLHVLMVLFLLAGGAGAPAAMAAIPIALGQPGAALQAATATPTPSATPSPRPPSGDWQISAAGAGDVKQLTQVKLNPLGAVADLAWSVDGKLLAAAGAGGVLLLDPATLAVKQVLETRAPTASLSFSADGKRLAASGGTGTLQVWNLADGAILQVIPGAGHFSAISADGRLVAAASDDLDMDEYGNATAARVNVRVFRVDSGKLHSTMTARISLSPWNTNPVETVTLVFSPDGSTLQAANNFGDVRAWQVSTGRLLNTSVNDHTRGRLTSGICQAAGETGTSFALACVVSYLDPPCTEDDPNCNPVGKLRYDTGLWSTSQLQRTNNLVYYEPPAIDLLLLYDPRQRKAGLLDAYTQSLYWPLGGGKAAPQSLNPTQAGRWQQMREDCKSGCAYKLALNPAGDRLALGFGGKIMLLNLANGDIVSTYENGTTALTSAALGAKGGWPVLAAGYSDGAVEILRLVSGEVEQTWAAAHSNAVRQLAFSGSDLISLGDENSIYLWRDGRRAPVHTWTTAYVFLPYPSNPRRFFLSPAAGLLLVDRSETYRSGQREQGMETFDLRSGQSQYLLPAVASAAAFSRDGKWLALADEDALVAYAAAGGILRQFTLPEKDVRAAAADLSPDGSLLAVSEGSQVLVINVNTHAVTAKFSFEGFSAGMLAFSPSGCLLAAGSNGGQLVLLDAASGKVLAQWWAHAGRLTSLAFSDDGRLLLSAGIDGAARVWGQSGALALPAGQPAAQTCRLAGLPLTSTPVTPTATATPVPATLTPTPVTFYRNLYLTSPALTGTDVLQLQQRLVALGYSGVGIPDGSFGPKTDAAVKLFQERNGLVVDGIVGPITWKRLFSEDAVRR